MQLRPDIQITSMIKAMTDVILPAVDPDNKLAVEQSQLIIGLLGLMARQLPIQFDFDRDELSRLLDSATRLQTISAPSEKVKTALEQLARCEATAAQVLAQCTINPVALLVSIRELHQAMGSIVTRLSETPDLDAKLQAERIILDMSKEQLLRDRSMLVSQGFERDPGALPSIDSLLGLGQA